MVEFNCPGVDSSGSSIVKWNWSFGDGATSTLQNPSHTYTTAGTFAPSLIATNSLGGAVLGAGPSISLENSNHSIHRQPRSRADSVGRPIQLSER